eukprot:273671-Prymnesium_polylepis.1
MLGARLHVHVRPAGVPRVRRVRDRLHGLAGVGQTARAIQPAGERSSPGPANRQRPSEPDQHSRNATDHASPRLRAPTRALSSPMHAPATQSAFGMRAIVCGTAPTTPHNSRDTPCTLPTWHLLTPARRLRSDDHGVHHVRAARGSVRLQRRAT